MIALLWLLPRRESAGFLKICAFQMGHRAVCCHWLKIPWLLSSGAAYFRFIVIFLHSIRPIALV